MNKTQESSLGFWLGGAGARPVWPGGLGPRFGRVSAGVSVTAGPCCQDCAGTAEPARLSLWLSQHGSQNELCFLWHQR